MIGVPWCVGALVLDLFLPQTLHLSDASSHPAYGWNFLLLTIQPEPVPLERGICARGGGGSEMILVEGHQERGISGNLVRPEVRSVMYLHAYGTIDVNSQE